MSPDADCHSRCEETPVGTRVSLLMTELLQCAGCGQFLTKEDALQDEDLYVWHFKCLPEMKTIQLTINRYGEYV